MTAHPTHTSPRSRSRSCSCSCSGTRVRWELDRDRALDLLEVLDMVEDFLRLASHQVVEELAAFPLYRPRDASQWAHALADYLGEQTVALRAATNTNTAATTAGEF